MRKLLYSLTFAFVLLLAGSAALADPAEPSGGGTVPDGDYQVWLPVVGNSSCVIQMEISMPLENALFRWGEAIPGQFYWQRIDDGGGTATVVVNLWGPGETYISILGYWGGANNVPNPVNWDLHEILASRNFSTTGEYRIGGSAMCPDSNQSRNIERRFYIVNESD